MSRYTRSSRKNKPLPIPLASIFLQRNTHNIILTPENMEDSALENELPVHVVGVFAMSYHAVSLADCGARTIWYWY